MQTPPSQTTSASATTAGQNIRPGLTLFDNVQTVAISNIGKGQQLTLPNGQTLILPSNVVNQVGSQQTLLMLSQQQLMLFFVSHQQVTASITLSAAQVSAIRQWLASGSRDYSKLSSELKSVLKGAFSSPNATLLGLKLSGQSLLLTALEQAPIFQYKATGQEQSFDVKTLTNMLQISLPLLLAEDKSSVLIEEKENSSNAKDEKIKFTMRFDLKDLGILTLSIQIERFKLHIDCQASTRVLFQKNEQFWPQLSDRISKIGFDLTSQSVLIEAPASSTRRQRKYDGLVSTKV